MQQNIFCRRYMFVWMFSHLGIYMNKVWYPKSCDIQVTCGHPIKGTPVISRDHRTNGNKPRSENGWNLDVAAIIKRSFPNLTFLFCWNGNRPISLLEIESFHYRHSLLLHCKWSKCGILILKLFLCRRFSCGYCTFVYISSFLDHWDPRGR